MHRSLVFILALGIGLSVGLKPVISVNAQSPSPEVSPELEATVSAQELVAPPLDQELLTLGNTYRGQLAEYREAERAFQIASQQYLQLNTLVSLENALQNMKRAMVLRDQVLITYLTILQRQLSSATGINLDQKNNLSTALGIQLEELRNHLQTVEAADTRDQIVSAGESFIELGKATEDVAYQVQTTLATGRLQTVYDKTTILANEIDQTLVQTTSDIKQGERQRAITEVRSALGRAKAGIDELVAKRRTTGSQSNFQSALRNLNQVYGDLTLSLDYLDELLRL